MNQLSKVDVGELQAKLQSAKLSDQENNVEFNKKRKNHYKGEFQKAKQGE